jgi:serine kinase of HPr protein (carbohydrate metabolism regulator)
MSERVPTFQIVKILLHDHVAPAGERRVLVADQHGVHRCFARRILRPVNETDEVAVIEETEAVHFIHRRHGIFDARHDLCRQLEA